MFENSVLKTISDEFGQFANDKEFLVKAFRINPSVSQDFFLNKWIDPVDDSGSLCLTLLEYNAWSEELQILSSTDRQTINSYLQDRVIHYASPRRGVCVALRGQSYYRMISLKDNPNLVRDLCFKDLVVDWTVLYLLNQYPSNSLLMVRYIALEHYKNQLIRIMYALCQIQLNTSNCHLSEQLFELERLIQNVWDNFSSIVLQDCVLNNVAQNLNWLIELKTLLTPKDFLKVRELDSPKTLFWFADRIFQRSQKFDLLCALLYGGIEMPFAYKAYCKTINYSCSAQFLPFIFSLNRMKKGEINLTTELAQQANFDELRLMVPECYIDRISQQAKILLCDNNITTGFSLASVNQYFVNNGVTTFMAVPEIYIEEIGSILACNDDSPTSKRVVIHPNQLLVDPLGEYITCFGFEDRSRLMDRVKFLLGKGEYLQLSGFDFDDTIAKTGSLHKFAWNQALQEMGIKCDVSTLPNNSGKTFEESAISIYQNLLLAGFQIQIPQNSFVKRLCQIKLRIMLEYDFRKVPLIARTVNLIREQSRRNQQVIVTNNKLDFVLNFLVQKNLLECFTHIICQDKAYEVQSQEVVILRGEAKPEITGYYEAVEYFGLPKITTYYGDNEYYDGLFASRIAADFVFIS